MFKAVNGTESKVVSTFNDAVLTLWSAGAIDRNQAENAIDYAREYLPIYFDTARTISVDAIY